MTRGPRIEDPRRVLLVRHGETSWNAGGRWQGRRDVPLSDRGREQARALGKRLDGEAFSAVFSSSAIRAQETARLASGRAAEPESDLVEISYGEWEGVRDVEVHERWPELRRAWGAEPDQLTLPGGESLADVDARAWPAFVRRLEEAPPGDVLFVLHGGVNRVLLARILRLPLGSFWRLAQDPSTLNVIELPKGDVREGLTEARVRLLNCTAHLRA